MAEQAWGGEETSCYLVPGERTTWQSGIYLGSGKCYVGSDLVKVMRPRILSEELTQVVVQKSVS